METVFQLQPTSIVTKELFRLRCSLYPHNIKEVDFSEKNVKVEEHVNSSDLCNILDVQLV